MQVGTPEHRDLFCRTFIETHAAFEPEDLPWPELDELNLRRLRAFPFWNYARSLEQRAGRMVSAFAETLSDPVIREAVALQGAEEARHGRLMSHVIERYGIDAAPLPIGDPPARTDDFCIFGFGECTDSFVGFGAFALVRQRALLPESLLSIFEDVLFEEARHIAFFVNWWRYEEARAGLDKPFLRTLRSLSYHVRAAFGTASGATELPAIPAVLDDPELDAIVKSITPMMFLEAALAENRRVMAKLHPRLLRPTLMPVVATALLLAIRMLPPRTPGASPPEPSANGATAAPSAALAG
ncbi:MAG TPA: ferritin-like domain-containing protein [Candidatus Elarobacter sp.]